MTVVLRNVYVILLMSVRLNTTPDTSAICYTKPTTGSPASFPLPARLIQYGAACVAKPKLTNTHFDFYVFYILTTPLPASLYWLFAFLLFMYVNIVFLYLSQNRTKLEHYC